MISQYDSQQNKNMILEIVRKIGVKKNEINNEV